MNKDLSACTGVIKGGAKSCPQKHNCKRFAVHSDKDKSPNQAYQPVPYQAVNNGVCSFFKEM